MKYAEAKIIVDVLIDAQMLKELDRNIVMDLLMDTDIQGKENDDE